MAFNHSNNPLRRVVGLLKPTSRVNKISVTELALQRNDSQNEVNKAPSSYELNNPLADTITASEPPETTLKSATDGITAIATPKTSKRAKAKRVLKKVLRVAAKTIIYYPLKTVVITVGNALLIIAIPVACIIMPFAPLIGFVGGVVTMTCCPCFVFRER